MDFKVPQISQAELVHFYESHFSNPATSHFAVHFLRPDESSENGASNVHRDEYLGEEHQDESYQNEYLEEEEYFEEEEDDGLGYYPDGVKRTLTDEQIAIFRHSEVEALLRAAESGRLKRGTAADPWDGLGDRSPKDIVDDGLSDGEISSSAPNGGAPQKKKKKKKRKRANKVRDEEPVDLRKRTWDVVETGLATLDYGEEGGGEAVGGEVQRRRVEYGG